MNNDRKNWKSGEGISVIMSNDALMDLIMRINGARPSEKPPQQPAGKCKLCIGIEDDCDTCLCRGQDEPVCMTITGEDKRRTVQIMACPSYYIVYEICQDGTKVRLFKGKRGTVYGFMKRIAEDSSKA
ncbi:hypothetical protein [uncultured Cloacibacillus sp.]|uniref:hypothetical protein n=1 Tax=uncultured Cloacibacillus sp. TaxID=889794 RepID=UPI0026DBFEE0|nr:hypothetical protein [uncultured Cloacibacillus sp.]